MVLQYPSQSKLGFVIVFATLFVLCNTLQKHMTLNSQADMAESC